MILRYLFLAVGMIVTVECSADVCFKWNPGSSSAQYWYNYPSTPQANSNAPTGYTVLSYISKDSVVDFNTGSMFASTYGSGAGQDVFAQANPSTLNGRYTTTAITNGAAGNGAGSHVNEFAYMVLVAIPYTTFATTYGGDITQIPAGTLYGVSGVSVALVQWDTTPPPTGVQQLNVGTVIADIALVPEPSTFALLGIGLGLVGLRRFRRK
jgi:hypothetical protein